MFDQSARKPWVWVAVFVLINLFALWLWYGSASSQESGRMPRRQMSQDAIRHEEQLAGPRYHVFLTADRGVYHYGERLSLDGVVVNDGVDNIPGLSLDLVLFDPERQEICTSRIQTDDAGRIRWDAQLDCQYRDGLYSIEARVSGRDEVIGMALFRIADDGCALSRPDSTPLTTPASYFPSSNGLASFNT